MGRWIGAHRREVRGHEVLAETLDRMLLYDQVNLANSAAAETIVRRLQVIEIAVNQNPEAPDYGAAAFLQSDVGVKDGAILDP